MMLKRRPRKKRSQQTTFITSGRLVDVVTMGRLAEIVGKSKKTLLRYEQKEIFPMAIYNVYGVRYYPISLAMKLVELVAQIPSNKKPDAELLVSINKVFQEERKLCQ